MDQRRDLSAFGPAFMIYEIGFEHLSDEPMEVAVERVRELASAMNQRMQFGDIEGPFKVRLRLITP